MESSAFDVVRQFERELCIYTGAPYAVTTTSCTMALLLAVAWHLRDRPMQELHDLSYDDDMLVRVPERPDIEIPKRTYVGVPMSIIHAGGRPTFSDEEWEGSYQLKPLPVWDSARLFTSGMYTRNALTAALPLGRGMGGMVTVSFHWAKHLGVQQGGAILHDSTEADHWLRRARFDGRLEGVAPKNQDPRDWIVGWHAYMAPETAAAGLVRLATLPRHNEPLPWGPGTDSDYGDLSEIPIFK